MVDALTFYKDLNSLMTEREYDSCDMLCACLDAFLAEWADKMQTEVLQTDKLELRLEYLESELLKIKELKQQFDIPDCNMVYKKRLELDLDGETTEIGASIIHDQAAQAKQGKPTDELPNVAAAQDAAAYSHKRASSSGTGQIQPRTSSKIMTANSSI